MKKCGEVEFSGNKLSELTEEELVTMAHNLYQYFPRHMYKYWELDKVELCKKIYEVLKLIDL
jgi:hypothetical protein